MSVCQRRRLVSTLAEWAHDRLSRLPSAFPAAAPDAVVERVLIDEAQLLFTEQDREWMTIDLIAGSGWASLEGAEHEVPRGQPITLRLEVVSGVPRKVTARRLQLLSTWQEKATTLHVEVTKVLGTPATTHLLITGGGDQLDFSRGVDQGSLNRRGE